MNRSTAAQLITYADRLAGDLAGLRRLLDGELSGVFGGVHILPFFVPIDGADAGFDPIDHTAVDPRIGSWDDVGAIAAGRDVMADLIVNHVSAHSAAFVEWLSTGDASMNARMFLTPERVFGGAPTAAQMAAIYRPRPTSPFTLFTFGDGTTRLVWTTFTDSQIDIDVEDELGWAYLVGILDQFHRGGITLVRLDAVGYAINAPVRRASCCPRRSPSSTG